MRRLTAALINTVTIVIVLAAPPMLLVRWTTNPLPRLVEALSDPHHHRPLPTAPAMIALVWLLWLLLACSLLAEAIARIRGIQVTRLPMLRPVQAVAAALAAGQAAASIIGSPAAAHSPPAALATTSAAALAIAAPTAAAAASARTPTADATVEAAAQLDTVTLLIDGCGYSVTVARGDTLWRIADECLGDPRRWPEIWELNRGRHWPHISPHTTLHDPDLIYPGWVLSLPADAAVPPGAQPTDNKPPTPPQTPTPPPVASPTTPANTPAPPSPPATAGAEDGVVELNPAPSVSLSPPGSASPSPSTPNSASATSKTPGHDPARQDRVADGVTMPGGWISAALGAALLTAVAWVWKRRRQRYIPTPISHHDSEPDPELMPPLAARTLIRQTLRRANPETLAEPVAGPTVRQFTTAQVKPALPQTGPSGTELAGAITLPLIAGMGLTGDGAHDAARGLLVAVLASGHPQDPDAQGRVIVPATTLATLLGVCAVDLAPMHRLTIAASLSDALGLIEEEIIRRSRIVAEAHVTDTHTLRADDALAEPLPQLLLLADTPEPASQARLLTAIGLGERLHIAAALLGTWPPGTTLTVNTDGTTTGDTGQRLAVLSADAAADTITMLREAHGDNIAAPAEHIPVLPATTGRGNADATPLREPVPAPPAGRVQVRILGIAAVLDATGEPVPKLRAKSVELLVYLAVHRKGGSLDQIMEAIWPDVTVRRASQRLSTCVANLRGVIRTAAHADQPAPDQPRLEPVINTGGHYRLDPAIVTVDWWTVLDETAHVASASTDQDKLAHLQAAITALQGPLADGADYEWIDTDREHVRRTHIRIYAQAADLLTPTDPHQAYTLLDTACDIDPLSEELARRSIQVAATLGDLDGIQHRLDTIRRDLNDAGTEFETDIQQLAATLIKQVHHAQREDN